ncbi:unnamed protein product [Ranitomeya imitator]|uniref:CLEC16A/TT9 C-terminal domain-containing protein n=1 Tax=Ranitomeya imitator TaxID=111125 RepID=A0ABN9LDM5_9NEOB|nr:unnamed protein product [Ranitomeya imitator]
MRKRGYIGGLSTAFQNAVDKPLMLVGLRSDVMPHRSDFILDTTELDVACACCTLRLRSRLTPLCLNRQSRGGTGQGFFARQASQKYRFFVSLKYYVEIEMVIMERSKAAEKPMPVKEENTTDEEKSAAAAGAQTGESRPFLDLVYSTLECTDDDYYTLFVLCLLYAKSHNNGINPEKLEKIQLSLKPPKDSHSYNHALVERLIRIMSQAARPGITMTLSNGKVRLATLELACILLKQLVLIDGDCIIKDVHLACLEGAREESVHLLRHFYKVKYYQNIT